MFRDIYCSGITCHHVRYNLSYEPAFALPWWHISFGKLLRGCHTPRAISLGQGQTSLPGQPLCQLAPLAEEKRSPRYCSALETSEPGTERSTRASRLSTRGPGRLADCRRTRQRSAAYRCRKNLSCDSRHCPAGTQHVGHRTNDRS